MDFGDFDFRALTKGLQEGKWLDKNLSIRAKDSTIQRLVKSLFSDKPYAFMQAKDVIGKIKEIGSKLQGQDLNINNLEDFGNFLDAFDAVTKKKYSAELGKIKTALYSKFIHTEGRLKISTDMIQPLMLQSRTWDTRLGGESITLKTLEGSYLAWARALELRGKNKEASALRDGIKLLTECSPDEEARFQKEKLQNESDLAVKKKKIEEIQETIKKLESEQQQNMNLLLEESLPSDVKAKAIGIIKNKFPDLELRPGLLIAKLKELGSDKEVQDLFEELESYPTFMVKMALYMQTKQGTGDEETKKLNENIEALTKEIEELQKKIDVPRLQAEIEKKLQTAGAVVYIPCFDRETHSLGFCMLEKTEHNISRTDIDLNGKGKHQVFKNSIDEVLQEYKNALQGVEKSQVMSENTCKRVNATAKYLCKENYPYESLLLKKRTLESIITTCSDWGEDVSIRSWVRSCLVNLHEGFNKLDKGKVPQQYRQEISELNGYLLSVEKELYSFKEEVHTDLLAPEKLPVKQSFDTKIQFSPQRPLVGIGDGSDVTIAPVLSPTTLPIYSDLSKEGIEKCAKNFDEWLTHCDRLKKQGSYERLDRDVAGLMKGFADYKQMRAFLDTVGNDRKMVVEWNERLYKIVSLATHAHMALHRDGIPPTRTLGLLRTFELLQDSLYLDKEAQFDEFQFCMSGTNSGIEMAMFDPYHDMGEQGPAIREVFERLKTKKKNQVSFDSSDYAGKGGKFGDFDSTNEDKYLKKIAKGWNEDTRKSLTTDLSSGGDKTWEEALKKRLDSGNLDFAPDKVAKDYYGKDCYDTNQEQVSKQWKGEVQKKIFSDFEGKTYFKPTFAHARQAFMLLNMTLARNSVLFCPTTDERRKMTLAGIHDQGRFYSELELKEMDHLSDYVKFAEGVSKALNEEVVGDITFEIPQTTAKEKAGLGYIIVKPFGVKYHPLETARNFQSGISRQWSTEGMSSFRGMSGPVKDPDIRSKIVTGVIPTHSVPTRGSGWCGTMWHHAPEIDDTGIGSSMLYKELQNKKIVSTGFGFSEEPVYLSTGENPTQDMIQTNKEFQFQGLSIADSQMIQMMQTAPKDRVYNTLLLCANASHLLNRENSIGSDLEKVVSLNLFRNNQLLSAILSNPQQLTEFVAMLKKLGDGVDNNQVNRAFYGIVLAQASIIAKEARKSFISQESTLKIMDVAIEELDKKLGSYRQVIKKALDEAVLNPETPNAELYTLHKAWMSMEAILPQKDYTSQELVSLFKSYFYLMHVARDSMDDLTKTRLQDFIDNLLPRFQFELDKPESGAILDKLVAFRFPGVNRQWESKGDGVFTTEQLRVDLKQGQILLSKQEFTFLPKDAREALTPFVDPSVLSSKHICVHKSRDGKEIVQFDITSGKHVFQVHCDLEGKEKPVIYRQGDSKEWYQLSTFTASGADRLPHDLLSQHCWVHQNGNSALFTDSQQRLRYSIEGLNTDSRQFEKIFYHSGATKHRVLNPRGGKEFAVFSRMADPSRLLYLEGETPGCVGQVASSDVDMTYTWDAKQMAWITPKYPGFQLTNQSINEHFDLLVQDLGNKQTSVPSLFQRDFHYYQLLEHPTQPPRLILPSFEYGRGMGVDKVTKHGRALVPIYDKEKIQPSQYAFEVDKKEGLRATKPEGNLYLAYLFYTQGKYPQAKLAMDKWFLSQQGLTPASEELLAWFDRWPTKDPNALALRVQLSGYQQRQESRAVLGGVVSGKVDTGVEKTLELYQKYLEVEKQIDPQMRMTQEQKRDIEFLAPRSIEWMTKESELVGKNTKLSQFIELMTSKDKQEFQHEVVEILNNEMPEVWAERLDKLVKSSNEFTGFVKPFVDERGSLGSFINTIETELAKKYFHLDDLLFLEASRKSSSPETLQKAIVDRAIDSEISAREKLLLEKPPETPSLEETKIFSPQSLFGIKLDDYLALREFNPKIIEKVKKGLEQFLTIFENDTSSSGKLAQRIKDDVNYYCESIGLSLDGTAVKKEKIVDYAGIKKGVNLELLTQKLSTQSKELKQRLQTQRQTIINNFILGEDAQKFSDLRRLKEQDPVVEDLFKQALYCSGVNNWQPLIDKGVISREQCSKMQGLVLSYLETLTEEQQTDKALQKFDTYKSAPDNTIAEQELVKVLQQMRQYDPKSHPYGAMLLLLESQLGLIVDNRQMTHFIEMLQNKSAFKHEIWGGGKTSVLRNLVAWYHANGYNLSGVVTLPSLIGEHHELLKGTTTGTYGQEVVKVGFTRQSPKDPLSLKLRYLELLKLTHNRGRIDMTMNTKISMDHSRTEMPLQEENKETLKIQAKILNFFEERLVVGSDEIKQVVNPEKQYNYATGQKVMLSQDVSNTSITLMELLSDSKFLPYFTQQQPVDMSQDERTELCKSLAEDIYKKLDLKCDHQKTIEYLTGTNQTDALKFYNEVICKEEKAEQLKYYKLYLTSVLPTSFGGKSGDSYGRSEKDKITIKPARDGEIQEDDQHGKNAMTAWYTCLDYLRHGVSSDIIANYMAAILAAAQKEATSTKISNLNETTIGQEFKKNFNFEITEVQPKDYESIAQKMNAKTTLKSDFIRRVIFENTTYNTARLTGTAQRAILGVSGFWGASGTDRSTILPRKVQKVEGMFHQKGAFGAIFVNMVKDFEENDLVEYDGTEPVEDFVAKQLTPGCAFVDVGSWFLGMSGEEIADKMAQALKKRGQDANIRSFGKQGEVFVRSNTGTTKGDKGFSLEEGITGFTKQVIRGANVPLAKGKTNFMPLSCNVNLDEFTQGGMRDRNWGNGNKFKFGTDRGFKKIIESDKRLATASGCIKLFAVAVMNEGKVVDKLNFASNLNDILAIGEHAVRKGLDQISDMALKKQFKESSLEQGYIEKKTEETPDEFGCPQSDQDTITYLQAQIEREKKKLQTLIEAYKERQDPDLKKCIKILENAITELSRGDLLLPKEDLPNTISVYESQNFIETQEQEIQVEQAQQLQVEQQQELQVEQELSFEIEQEEIEEKGKIKPREGSHTVYWGQATFALEKTPLGTLFSNINITTSPVDPDLEKSIGSKEWYKGSEREKYSQGLWIRGRTNFQQLLVPACLIQLKSNSFEVNLGHVKDKDTYWPKKIKDSSGSAFIYDFNSVLTLDEQLSAHGVKDKQIIEKIKKSVAMSKVIYGGVATFTEEEKGIIKEWWKTMSNDERKVISQNLKTYLNKHFPSTSDHALLKILEIA